MLWEPLLRKQILLTLLLDDAEREVPEAVLFSQEQAEELLRTVWSGRENAKN